MLNTFSTLQTAQTYASILCMGNRKTITTFLRTGSYESVIATLKDNNLLPKQSIFSNVVWIEIHKALMITDSNFIGNPLEISKIESYFGVNFKHQSFKLKGDQIMLS